MKNDSVPISSVEYTTENGIKKIDLTDAVIKLNTVLEQYIDNKVIRDNIINSFYNKFVTTQQEEIDKKPQ